MTKDEIIERVGDEIIAEMSEDDMVISMQLMLVLGSIGMRASRKTVAALRMTANHIERGLDALETRQ